MKSAFALLTVLFAGSSFAGDINIDFSEIANQPGVYEQTCGSKASIVKLYTETEGSVPSDDMVAKIVKDSLKERKIVVNLLSKGSAALDELTFDIGKAFEFGVTCQIIVTHFDRIQAEGCFDLEANTKVEIAADTLATCQSMLQKK